MTTNTNEPNILPREYVIHRRTQRCANCGTTHDYSEAYAHNILPPNYSMGKHVDNLIPVRQIIYNLPVRVVTIDARVTPVCHECWDTIDLSMHSDPRLTPEWHQEFTREAGKVVPKKPKPTKPPARKYSLAELSELLK